MSKFGSIGFAKGVYAYKHSKMGFSDKIERVYDLEENEELTFTAFFIIISCFKSFKSFHHIFYKINMLIL